MDSQLRKFTHSKLMSSLCSVRNYIVVYHGLTQKLSYKVFSYVRFSLTPTVHNLLK